MNKKGFTLVELLAVIVILALLALVANSSVTNVVRNTKSDLYNTQIVLIESAAKTWGTENVDKMPEVGTCSYLKLKDLKRYGILSDDIVNPKTDKAFPDDLYIKITTKVNDEGALKIKYEVDANNIDSCIEIYPPVCALVEGNENEIGSKYECEVKPGVKYIFYVLSYNDKNGNSTSDKSKAVTTNLIMNSNICNDGSEATEMNTCLVEWISQADFNDDENWGGIGNNTKGPITAMNYLYDATYDWSNIGNILLDYEDEGKNYRRIKTSGNVTTIISRDNIETASYADLKVRLPYLLEVSDLNESNQYLYENLVGITGYWVLSTYTGRTDGLKHVNSGGSIGTDGVNMSICGVRPVINVEL